MRALWTLVLAAALVVAAGGARRGPHDRGLGHTDAIAAAHATAHHRPTQRPPLYLAAEPATRSARRAGQAVDASSPRIAAPDAVAPRHAARGPPCG